MGWLLLALLLMGAAPETDSLPVPPVPPGELQSGDAAPVPNSDVHAPTEPPPDSVRLAPSLYHQGKIPVPGEGYMPGSSFKQNEEERINKPGPGFNLRVTLP